MCVYILFFNKPNADSLVNTSRLLPAEKAPCAFIAEGCVSPSTSSGCLPEPQAGPRAERHADAMSAGVYPSEEILGIQEAIQKTETHGNTAITSLLLPGPGWPCLCPPGRLWGGRNVGKASPCGRTGGGGCANGNFHIFPCFCQ